MNYYQLFTVAMIAAFTAIHYGLLRSYSVVENDILISIGACAFTASVATVAMVKSRYFIARLVLFLGVFYIVDNLGSWLGVEEFISCVYSPWLRCSVVSSQLESVLLYSIEFGAVFGVFTGIFASLVHGGKTSNTVIQE